MSLRLNKIISVIAIGLYLGFLVWFCILSRETEVREVSLIGDTFIAVCKYPWTWILLVMIVANVLLYVPIGVLLQRITTSKIKVILLGVLISIGIEVLQLMFSLGTFDYDDIINNFMGTIIGAYFQDGIESFRDRRFRFMSKGIKITLVICALYSLLLLRHICLHLF